MHADAPSVLQEIVDGDGLTLGQAARLLPAHRGGGRACRSSIWRQILTGSKSPTGEIVKLEAAKLGGRYLTSRGALRRYMAAITPTAEPTPASPRPRSESKAKKASQAAGLKLAAIGA